MNKRKVLSILLLALITVTLAVSCSGSIDAPVQDAEELAYVTFGNGHSRGLSTSYETEAYGDLYWSYKATKDDHYGTTGATTAEKPVIATYDSQGTITAIDKGLSGRVGPFSQGKWNFELFAYKNAIVSDGSVIYKDEDLVYQGNATGVILKGGEVKNVPVSVSLKGDYGKVSISNVKFYWAENGGSGSPKASLHFVGAKSSNDFTVTAPTLNYVSATETEKAYFSLSVDEIPHGDDSSTTNIPADYYTVTATVYLPDSADTPLVTQIFGLRVYGNATTVITGDLTEGIDSYVLFDVAKQDMKVFVPNANGSASITNISITPSGEANKNTTVEFETGALSAVADKTLQLDVKVTTVEAANNKFNISGTTSENKSAFAGIDVTLWATDTDGASNKISDFATNKYATVTTYIAKGLTNVVVKYNGTGKDDPIANSTNTNVADTLSTDEGTNLGYNPSTGLLRFKTKHFSEYYVLADCVVLNETTNVGYGGLQEAFDKAKDGEVIKLIDDITSNTGFCFKNNVEVTFDLNRKTLKVTNDIVNNHRALKVTAGTLTIKNGTIDARNIDENGIPQDFNNETYYTQGIYGTVRVETEDSNYPANAVLENLTLYNNHLWGMSVKVCENSNAEVKNCNFISRVGGCIEAEGGIVNVESSSFSQEVTSNYSSYISTGIAVSYLGSITVNNTESFNVSGAQALYVYSSGGEIIVNGGNYSATGNNAVIEADFDKNNYGSQNGIDEFKNSHNGKASVVVVNDGNFVGSFEYGGNKEYCQIKIKGGTFSTDPSAYVPAFGYNVDQNTDCNYVVSEAPLEINNAQDLMNFAASVNAGNDYEGKTITLNADINLTGKEWVPIGNAENPFKGTFDGDNHKISNLTFTSTSAVCVGLFGYLDGGIVENLIFDFVNITGSEDVGTVVGRIINNGKVENVHVLSGTVNCTTKRVGGLVGSIKAQGSIIDCTNAATVSATGTARNAGGIVGSAYYTEAGKEMYISNCVNSGAVTSADVAAGGIVSLSAANVIGCTNEANIQGNGTSIGGIVGEQKSYGSVTNNINSGNVTNTNSGSYGNGGIIGWLRYHGTGEASSYAVSAIISVTGNKNSGNVSGGNDAGGIIGTVYNSAVVTGNENTSNSLSGTTFAAGIVGNYQTTEIPAASGPASNKLTFKDNTSLTAMENISASNKNLLIYTNGNSIIQ